MLGVAESERALEMADETYARFDVEAVVAHLSTALRGYTAVDAKCSAAMVCVRLGDTLANAMGNLTASRAWFARARRLVEHEPPCLEGMALLDEAMALACGPADDPGTVAKSVCSFFTACYFATDFERAASWAGLRAWNQCNP